MSFSKYGVHFDTTEIEVPPTLLRPGATNISLANQAEIMSEITHHAEYFDAACEFWLIMNQVGKKHFAMQGIPSDTALEFAEASYQKLLSWAAKLPLSLARGEETKHNIMLMQ
jgi:hypothetical protein